MQQVIFTILVSFIVALALGKIIIPLLRRLKAGQQIREDGPQSHLSKAGTPTMGGIIFIIALIIGCLIFSRGALDYTIFALAITVGFTLIGFIDDLIIVVKKRSLGLKAYQKIIAQLVLAVIVALFAYTRPELGSEIYIPFANIYVDLGWWYIPFTVFVVLAVVNSVNLTDGLDGLASGVSVIDFATFTLIFIGLFSVAKDAGDLLGEAHMYNMMIFCGAITGGVLGFLRFNTYPAKVFMGDTGAFGLGAALCVMAITSKMHLMLPIIGFMFMLSSISVILQVGSYKLRKKRIFKMAPIHHHFELKGVPETKIVAMYMIITVILCLIGLLILN